MRQWLKKDVCKRVCVYVCMCKSVFVCVSVVAEGGSKKNHLFQVQNKSKIE